MSESRDRGSVASTGKASSPAARKPALTREEWRKAIGPYWEDVTDEAVEQGLAFIILGGRPAGQAGGGLSFRDDAPR